MLPFLNSKLADVARDENCLIIFPHTQRTGGKALRDKVLVQAFGRDRVYSKTLGTGMRDWPEVTTEELKAFRVFTGPFAFADVNKRRPTIFLGLVRHPLYRAASLYFYCRERKSHPQHELALTNCPASFYREAVKRNPHYFANLQAVRLCGKASASRALSVIKTRYVAVGATDDLQAFANLLADALGWPAAELGSRPNEESRYSEVITPEFREVVLRHNDQDLEIFQRLNGSDPLEKMSSRWRPFG